MAMSSTGSPFTVDAVVEDLRAKGDDNVRADAEAKVVGRWRSGRVDRGRLAETDQDLGASDRQVLAGADKNGTPFQRHELMTRRERGKGFDL